MKQAPLRQLSKTTGTREILKLWVHNRVVGGIRTETETRTGRRRLRAIRHQARLRQQARVPLIKFDDDD